MQRPGLIAGLAGLAAPLRQFDTRPESPAGMSRHRDRLGKLSGHRGRPEVRRDLVETEVAGLAAERLCRRSDILRRECWPILLLRYALGHIDVLHAQQLNQTIIVYRGSDHE
jgi:hypothetical protein